MIKILLFYYKLIILIANELVQQNRLELCLFSPYFLEGH